MIVEKLKFRDPAELFFTLKAHGYPVKLFLDSASVNLKTGRYSFIAVGSEEEFVFDERAGGFNELESLFFKLRERFFVTEVPYGLMGYVSYDANTLIEEVPSPKVDDIGMPLLHFFLPHTLFFFDNLRRELYLVSHEPFKVPDKKEYVGEYKGELLSSNMDEEYFEWAVKRIKDYIASGDTFQVNFSQRLDLNFLGDPVSLYRELRRINPSPFSFYMELGEFKAVSCSPERLLQIEGRVAQTRPIAGTRRRGRTAEEDEKLKRELLLSEKERA
ncbi:MAG: chorismate-binding protein, partial [Desulfurobacteriaceae bacterium]